MAVKAFSIMLLSSLATKSVLAASPPACLLALANTLPNPADLAAACSIDPSTVSSQIHSFCGDDSTAAMSAYSSICTASGYTVAAAALPDSYAAATSAAADSTASASVAAAATTPATYAAASTAASLPQDYSASSIAIDSSTTAGSATSPALTLVTGTAGSSAVATTVAPVAVGTGGAIASSNGTFTAGSKGPAGTGGPAGYNANGGGVVQVRQVGTLVALGVVGGGFVLLF